MAITILPLLIIVVDLPHVPTPLSGDLVVSSDVRNCSGDSVHDSSSYRKADRFVGVIS